MKPTQFHEYLPQALHDTGYPRRRKATGGHVTQTFQRFMDQVLRGVSFCYVYIDDLLIASATPEATPPHCV